MASFDCRLLFSSLFVISTANIILSSSFHRGLVRPQHLSVPYPTPCAVSLPCLGISLSYLGVFMAVLFSLDIYFEYRGLMTVAHVLNSPYP